MKKTSIAGGLFFSILMFFWFGCVHYTDINQVAIVWNRFGGELTLDTVPGFNVTAPWVKVSRIDTRPQRVCITSASRSFNCKLVKFNSNAYKDLVAIEGMHYYWLYNRISFNGGYREEYRGLRDLLRGYAFSSSKYPFVVVLEEYGDPQ